MINTKFFCRLCALLHEPTSLIPGHHYDDFNDWWRGEGTCIDGSWRKYDASLRNNKNDNSLTEIKIITKDCNDKGCEAKVDTKIPQPKLKDKIDKLNKEIKDAIKRLDERAEASPY